MSSSASNSGVVLPNPSFFMDSRDEGVGVGVEVGVPASAPTTPQPQGVQQNVPVGMDHLDGSGGAGTPTSASRVYVRGRATGSQNFNASDLERLIDAVEQYGSVPSCTANWQFVANFYNETVAKFNLTATENSARVQRHASSLAQRFHRIFTKNAGKKLSECPNYVRRANAIRHESESPEQHQQRQQLDILPGLAHAMSGDPDQSMDTSTVSVGAEWAHPHDLEALSVRDALKALQDMITAHSNATQQLFHQLEQKIDMQMNHVMDQVSETQEHIQTHLNTILDRLGDGSGSATDENGQPLTKKPRK